MLDKLLSNLGLQNVSKTVGAVVGAGFGILVSKYGLPADLASVEIQTGVTMIVTGLVAYLFPANRK